MSCDDRNHGPASQCCLKSKKSSEQLAITHIMGGMLLPATWFQTQLTDADSLKIEKIQPVSRQHLTFPERRENIVELIELR
jgi:hypothetical protein